jgi:hypothetical protein
MSDGASESRPHGPPTSRGRTGSAGLAVVLTIALAGLLAVSAPSARATWSSAPVAWTNGVVLCSFSSAVPEVAVSASGLNQSGISASVGLIEEVSEAGSPVARALTTGAAWTVTNQSGESTFDLEYSAHLPVRSVPTGAVVGSVDVRVDFVLPAYTEAPSDNLSSVELEVEISNWTWQASGDALELLLPIAPAFSSTEHLALAAGASLRLLSVANASGTPREQLVIPQSATASSGSASFIAVNVTPSLSVQPANASVTLRFGTNAG